MTSLYYLELKTKAKPGDDVAEFSYLTLDQFYEPADKYESFGSDDNFIKGDYHHSWQDYGKVYGPIHRIAADYIKSLRGK